ncbi:MAG: uroporphyrinogen-III C-methyltransferase [Rickettsiales bacterium]|nr:uroporphyrinogen-III C-methyltransferase [Rickettsiales bacterium]
MTNSQNNPSDIKQDQYLPVFLSTDKSKILLVGGGAIAVAKLRLITDFASDITVIAKEVHDEIKLLAESKDFKIIEAEFALDQLGGFDIIVAATDDSKVNAEISKHAKQQNILVNVVDDSSLSNFIFGSVVKRDNLTVAISSNGISPVLTRLIKQKIEHLLPMTLGKLTNFIAKYRDQVKQSLTNIQARRLFWQDVIEGNIAEEVYIGNEQKAGELLVGALSDTDDKNTAALYLIGAGPGDPDLITLKASRLIAKADVILYDRLVSKELFNFARKEVIKINVGKTKSLHRYRQSETNELIKEYGKKGKIIVRLKGGDTAVFANLIDEIEAAKEINIPYQIVPGITAASGAAAYLGIALTIRDEVRSVRYLTYYEKDLLREDYWQELAGSTDSLVFYMSTHHIEEIINQLLKYDMDGSTPIIAVSQATTPFQAEYLATLADFNNKYRNHKFASPTIVIIGKAVNNYKDFSWHESSKIEGLYFDQLEART